MHDAKKRAQRKGSDAASGARSGGKSSDANSEQLRKIGSKLGNDELQQRIQKGNGNRDELMEFLRERLQTIRGVQKQEIELSDYRSMRENWKDISDKNRGIGAPDPMRWRETAKIYEEAAYQLARGSLGRGKQLVERGMAEENRAFDQLTPLVKKQDVEMDELQGASSLPDVGAAETCAATSVPADIRDLARDIQRVEEKPMDVPWRKRTRDPWWTLEEEEEEEESEGG